MPSRERLKKWKPGKGPLRGTLLREKKSPGKKGARGVRYASDREQGSSDSVATINLLWGVIDPGGVFRECESCRSHHRTRRLSRTGGRNQGKRGRPRLLIPWSLKKRGNGGDKSKKGTSF